MSDVGIFIVGALMFIATAWATIAFGLSRFHELQRLDMESAERTATVRPESSFTEVWVPSGEAAGGSESPPEQPDSG